MNIQTITQILIDSGIEVNEAKREIKMLLEHFCNYTENDKIRGVNLDNYQLSILKEKVELRASTRKPIQHIIGQAWFMGEFFKISPNVLIPRDETEILVTRAIELIRKNKFTNVLDIGTGSGCIACTIAKQTEAVALGVDISTDALRVALDNVTKLGINNRAVFRKSDLFERVRPEEKFDIIISNPPYIPYGTKLDTEVCQEPQLALFAEENGLEFYRKITEQAPEYLKEDGYLMFELGIGEAEGVKQFMEKDFNNITIEKDLAGIERVIYGQIRK